MELEQAIHDRRSIRRYTKELVGKEDIKKIIEAGIYAPSACNVQGWKFIVIDEADQLKKMQKNGGAAFLRMIHQAVLVLYDNQITSVDERWREQSLKSAEYMGYIQSGAACMQNMCLMAYSMGIGTCWVNLLPSKMKMHEIFQIPDDYDVIGLLALGYYEDTPSDIPRKQQLDDIIVYNTF